MVFYRLTHFYAFSLYMILNGVPIGIVPILSLLKQHVRQILKYDAEAFFEDLQDRSEIIHRVEVEREKQKGSLAKKITHLCSDRHNVAGTRKDEIRRALRESMHGMETLYSWRDIQASRSLGPPHVDEGFIREPGQH